MNWEKVRKSADITLSLQIFYDQHYCLTSTWSCYRLLRFYCHVGAHRRRAGAHGPPWGIRYPLGRGLSHLSWWMSGLPDCTFSFHFLPGCTEALPPTVRCHLFNPFPTKCEQQRSPLHQLTRSLAARGTLTNHSAPNWPFKWRSYLMCDDWTR